MFHTIQQNRFGFAVRLLSAVLVFSFLSTTILPPGYAQSIGLPLPGAMVSVSPAFVPVLLKGMTVHPDNPLQFDFIIDSGNAEYDQQDITAESQRLVKYFLASMTVPHNDLWVNLSPYEKDRIIPEELGKTELGRDLLAQDYILKQPTATLVYPENELGKKFWDRIHKAAKERYGLESVPTDVFNKVWILPETAVVYEHKNTVYIVDTHLKVMLDEDYIALQKSRQSEADGTSIQGAPDVSKSDELSQISKDMIRELILPEIEKEVNQGKNFAPLRQIYHSLILAKWYKQTVKNSLMSQVYIDRNKTAGIEIDDEGMKERIYEQYMDAYKQGVFNYIKEDYDELSQTVIPRQYFSGGFQDAAIEIGTTASAAQVRSSVVGKNLKLALEVRPETGAATNASVVEDETPKENPAEKLAQELASVENLVAQMVSEGYDEHDIRLIIDEHWKRLRQREPIDMRQDKWLERMELSVQWWMKFRKDYDHQLVNIFGPTEQQKQENVAKAAKEFREILEKDVAETGNKFFIYSGGSGVGKSTIWSALKKTPEGKKFKKFLMYHTRERRPDEDPEFQEDLVLDTMDPSLASAITLILKEEVDVLSAINVDNVSAFKDRLLQRLASDGVSLSDSARASLDKILDLNSLGENGRRIDRSLKNIQNGQDERISLAERIGRTKKGKIRIYGEFDGVQYYFTDEVSLKNGDEGDVIILPYGSVPQAVSFKGIQDILKSQSDDIFVLETTPENVEKIKNKFPQIKSIFVSPFKTVAVVGASGFAGQRIYSALRQGNSVAVIGTSFSAETPDFQRLDVTKEDEIKKFIAETRPDVIVYAAGEADPQEADKDPQAAEYLNAGAVNAFRKYFNGHFVYLSSDYVFDGKKETPYEASDSPSPINFYGQTKQRGEDAVRQFEQHSIIRSGMLFGRNTPDDRSNFVTETVQKIERGEPVEADDTQIRYPLSIYDLAEAVKTVISNETYGTSQINGAEGLTKKEFAQRIQQIYIEEASKDQTASSQKTVPILASRSASQITVPANAHMKNSFSVSGVDEGLRRTVRSVSNKLKGGSTNNLKMIKTDFGQRRVRKESPSGSWGRDKKKFTAQVQWLLGLPAQLRPFFSRVVRHNLEVHYKGEKDNELLDAVSTKTGRPSGLFVTRGSAHKNGTAHRVVHVVIYNRSTGKILIQKRAQRPDVNAPGQKDFFGGHVGASAEEDLVAIKEISQEVKLNPGEYELIKVGEGLRSIGSKDQKADDYIDEEGIFHYQSQQENNEYAALYVAVTDVPAEEINRRIKKTQATAATAENLEVEGVINVSPEDLAAEAADVQAKTAYASPVRAYFANGDVRSIILNLAQNIPGTSVDTKGEQQPYYEMPFYEGRTLTQSIIYDQQNADFIINRLKEVLSFWREHMLGARTAPVPEMYLKEVLIDRVRESLEQVKRQAPEVFQSVIEAEYIVINGKRHRNVLPLLLELEQNPELLKRLAPPALRLTHGDFHFDNMFFREDGGFVLLDPRGDYVGDPVYDLAKIAHTVIGKYDLLNYDLEKTTRQENPDGTVSITVEFPEDSHAWQVYQELERRFPALAEEFFGSSEFAKNDPYWQQRLSASLAKIMANLPIYHLKNDGKEERALALYAEGVVFFNELFDSLESIETKPAAGEATNAATLSETEAEELIQQNIRPEYHSLITRDNILRVIELSEQGYDFDIVHQNERIEGGRKVKIGELTTGWGWYGSSLTQYNLLIDSEGNEYGRGDPREDETVESWIVIGDGYAIVGRENLAYTPEKIEIIRKEKTETNASILSGPWTLSGARKRLKNVNFIESKESAKGVIRAIHLIGKQKEHTNDDINLLKKILAAVIDDAYVNDIENTIKQYLTNQQLVDAYIEALGSSQSSVVAQARIKLVELSDAKAIEPLLKALAKHPSPETESAIKKLGASNEQLVDAYIQMLQSIWVSQASIRLGELGDTKAIEPLLKALIEYASPETESALKKLGVSNEQLVDAYIQALPSDRTAQTSIRLGELGDTKAIEPLLKALAQHALPETETVLKKIGATNEQLVDAYIQA
ncbi:MAG TPA: sugar nucleotide-binding protein, partial [Candidatus Omnitrophota bacterium]|nr:sugar nucleotide-binding protein [Candidatus Omnitrophota bacterium]